METKFIPGSEWIYLKLYANRYFSDHILENEINNIYNFLLKNDYITKFFFIRYSDPFYHLRIRFKLSNIKSYDYILNKLYLVLNKYVKNDVVWKIQVDTYNREIERYNKLLIDSTETLFFVDSKYCIIKQKIINKLKNENYKWMIALKSIDSYLNLFTNNNIFENFEIINNMSTSFKQEYLFDDNNSKILNKLYREKRHLIEDIIDGTTNDMFVNKLGIILKKRDAELEQVINTIKNQCQISKLDYKNYLPSYIHMNINRLIPSNNRIHELLLYDYLKRYYASSIARNKVHS